MRNQNGKNRNGKKAAAARRKGAVAMSVRARFVEAETLALKREGLSFVEIAAQITRIGRSQAQARTPMGGVTFPADFKISSQACHLAYHRVLANEPLMEIEALRKEQAARCESFIGALRGAIENGDPRAIRVALKTLEHQGRLFGVFKQPEGRVEINVAALTTLDLNTLKLKDRQALMIRLFDLDGLPLEIVRQLIDAGLDHEQPSPSPTPLPPPGECLRTQRALASPAPTHHEPLLAIHPVEPVSNHVNLPPSNNHLKLPHLTQEEESMGEHGEGVAFRRA